MLDDAYDAGYDSCPDGESYCGDDTEWTSTPFGIPLGVLEGGGSGAALIPDAIALSSWSCEPTDAYTDAQIDIGYADGEEAGYDTGYAAGELSVDCGVCPACGEDDACGVTSLYEDDCGVCGGPGLNDDGCCGDETMDCHGDCGGQGVEDECGVCDGDGSTCLGPECTDDADWESTYGSCSSYALGQANHTYCDGDTGWDGVLAAEACPAACAAPGDDCWVDPECQYEHLDHYTSSGTCVESIACCYFVGGYGNGVNWLVCESGWAEVSMCQETIIN